MTYDDGGSRVPRVVIYDFGTAGRHVLNLARGPLATVFPDAELLVQPRAGHFPWLDDPDLFVQSLASRLS